MWWRRSFLRRTRPAGLDESAPLPAGRASRRLTGFAPRAWSSVTRAIVVNASSLVGTTVVTSALGFVYWWLAAREFSPAAVGFASAAFSAMTLIGTIGVLGLGTLLTSELPRRPDQKESLSATALTAAGIAAGVLGLFFAILAPRISPDLRSLAQDGFSVTLFAIAAALTSIILVLDQLLITLLQGGLRFWRNVIFSVVKLGALLVAGTWWAHALGMAIFASWIVGYVVSLIALLGIFAWKGGVTRIIRPQWGVLRGLGLVALAHHLLNVALQVTSLTMPLLVTAVLSTTANAYFYTAQMITMLVSVGPTSLTTMLYVVGAADPTALAQRTRFTLGAAALTCGAANIVVWIGGTYILATFGHSYAENAIWPLRISSLTIFCLVVREHYVVICRVHGRMARIVPLVLSISFLRLLFAGFGAHINGLVGLSLGAAAASCAEALIMAPVVWCVASGAGMPRRWYGGGGRRPFTQAAVVPVAADE